MASITITIPDEVLPRVQAAGINKAWVIEQVKNEVKAFEARQVLETERAKVEAAEQAAETAVTQALDAAEAELTLS